MGPRPSAELLFELIAHDDIEADVVARLESYAELEPLVRVIPEARTWPPAPITVVP